jgi:O-antigen/teichoic acid export membrane protein
VTSRGRSGATLDAVARVARHMRASTGFRASGVLLAGVVANIGGGYLYNLICIRWLGPRDYGEVAALTAVATIVLLPLVGVQAALAREVAAFSAVGNVAASAALLRLTLRRTAVLSGAGFLVLLVLSPGFRAVLNIDALTSVVAAVTLACAGAALPILQGFLQGLERFRRIAVALVFYGFARPVLTIPILLAGFGVAGALSAATIAATAAAGIALAGLGDLFSRRSQQEPVALELGDFKPVIFGLLAFTALMNADVIAAKMFLDEDDAGTYASASLVGKLAALLPAGAIAPVLLPRATARLERGESPVRLVSAALLATAAFGALLTLILAPVPRSLVEFAFGEQFGEARDLLAPCAAVMTLYGIINVSLAFAFALRDRLLVMLLGAAVVVEAALLAVLHGSQYQILFATALAALAVIVPHELRSPNAIWRLVRAA